MNLIEQVKAAALKKMTREVMRMTLDELFVYLNEEGPPTKTKTLEKKAKAYRESKPTFKPKRTPVPAKTGTPKEVFDAVLTTLSDEGRDGGNIAILRDATGFDNRALRHAIRSAHVQKALRTEGEKRSTRYFLTSIGERMAAEAREAKVSPPPPMPKKQLEILTTPPPPPSKGHPHVVRRPGKGAAK